MNKTIIVVLCFLVFSLITNSAIAQEPQTTQYFFSSYSIEVSKTYRVWVKDNYTDQAESYQALSAVLRLDYVIDYFNPDVVLVLHNQIGEFAAVGFISLEKPSAHQEFANWLAVRFGVASGNWTYQSDDNQAYTRFLDQDGVITTLLVVNHHGQALCLQVFSNNTALANDIIRIAYTIEYHPPTIKQPSPV